MFPLYDESRTRTSKKFPFITISLIFINCVIFFFTLNSAEEVIKKYGIIPQDILQGKNLITLLTGMFLHGSFFHLLGNMWFLWVFGDNLERAIGRIRFLIFYLICGVVASLFQIFLTPLKDIPMIGASGAISGVLGGYFLLFPRNRIRALVPLGIFLTIIPIPAVVFLFLWVIYQFLITQPGVATQAHIMGFFTGFLLVNLFKMGKIRKKRRYRLEA